MHRPTIETSCQRSRCRGHWATSKTGGSLRSPSSVVSDAVALVAVNERRLLASLLAGLLVEGRARHVERSELASEKAIGLRARGPLLADERISSWASRVISVPPGDDFGRLAHHHVEDRDSDLLPPGLGGCLSWISESTRRRRRSPRRRLRAQSCAPPGQSPAGRTRRSDSRSDRQSSRATRHRSAATRAMLCPWTPCGWPHPRMTSSTSAASSAESFRARDGSRATASSSERVMLNEPRCDLASGVLLLATMTASLKSAISRFDERLSRRREDHDDHYFF